jgi:hypothetical protein
VNQMWMFVKRLLRLHLNQSILCNSFVDKEYVNAEFSVGILTHGAQYVVCIHADNVTLEYETWSEILPEVSTCSDGVTVDLTPPTAGLVWIGHDPDTHYQVYIIVDI